MPDYIGVNRDGLITYGGGSSSDYGMVVSEAPTFEQPKRKLTVFTVPGRNGSVLFEQDAFEDVVRSYKVWVAQEIEEDSGGSISGTLAERVNAITSWLNSLSGYQELSDSFEPDVYRLAYYSGGNDVSNELMQYGETTLTFTCRPERFLVSAKDPVTVVNNSVLNNPTLFKSKPLIHIEGSGIVEVGINGVTIGATVDGYINIDCERLNAYRAMTENMNGSISGAFPVMEPGNNTITISGSPTLVQITPKYFII